MPLNHLRVLITGCFAPGTQGTVFGLKKMNLLNLEIYGIDSNLLSKSLTDFNELFEIKNVGEEYIEKIIQIALSKKIEIILPQTNPEVLLLSKYISRFEGVCKVLLAGNQEVVEFANDKLRLLELSQQLKIPTADYSSLEDKEKINRLVQQFNLEDKNFYLKAKNDSGGRGIIKILPNNRYVDGLLEKPHSYHIANLNFFKNFLVSDYNKKGDFFIMEEFAGQEYTVDIFRTEFHFLAIPRRRIKIRSGVSQVNNLEQNQTLIEISKVFAESIGLVGIFGLQFIYSSDQKYTIIECNPRIQGTNYASILAGSNLIEYACLYLMGYEFQVVEPIWKSTFIRTSTGFLVEQSK